MRIPFTNLVITRDTRLSNAYGAVAIGLGRGQAKRFTPESMFALYRDNSDMYSCIREWRESVGQGGYEIETKGEKETRPQDAAEIDAILNYYQPWRTLKGNTVRDFGVTGNAYWEIVQNENKTKVVAVSRLDPRTIKIVSDEHGNILKYIQSSGQKTVDFNPNDIVHFRLDADPDNELFGFSPAEPIFWEALTDQQAKETNFRFFENRAKPGVWYILNDNIGAEKKTKLIEDIKTNLGGAGNYNKSAILDGVKEIKSFDITNKDMEYLLGRQYITDKICAAYGVPKFLLGYTDTTNYNNGRALMMKFYEGTSAPIESMVAETINRSLIAKINPNLYLEFNAVNFTEEYEIERRALTELQAGAITLRQYKCKTGQDITPDDERQPNFDAYILASGASAVLLEDVGVDPATVASDQFVNSINKNYDLSKLSR